MQNVRRSNLNGLNVLTRLVGRQGRPTEHTDRAATFGKGRQQVR